MRKSFLFLYFLFCMTLLNAQGVVPIDSALNATDSASTYTLDSLLKPKDTLTSSAGTDTLDNAAAIRNLKAYQQEKIQVKKFNPARWKEIAGKTDFEETEKKIEKAAKSTTDWSFLSPVAWVVMFALIGLLVYLVVKNTSWNNKRLPQGAPDEDISKPVTNINEFDLTTLLRQAIANGDFRLAIRIYYLEILRKLNASGKIVWKKDKTNRDYLSELFAIGYFFDEIRGLTLTYEQVWYGEHEVSAEAFRRLSINFERIQNQLDPQ